MSFQHSTRTAESGSWSLLTLIALCLASCGGSSTDSTAEIAATNTSGEPAEAAPAPVDLFATPLKINGEEFGREYLRRAVALGPQGTIPLEMSKTRLFIEEEIDRRVKAGSKREDFEVSQEDIDTALRDAEAKVREEFPDDDGIELKHVLAAGPSGMMDRVRMTKLFTNVFLPDNPHDYPEITVTALQAGQNGPELLAHLKKTYDDTTAKGEEDGGRALLNALLYQEVSKYLNDTAVIVEAGDELPLDVLMRVNGVDIMVDDVWPVIEANISERDVRSAKQWTANMKLLVDALKVGGVYLTDEEATQAYAEHSDPYKDSLFSIERIATVVKKFPSISAYKEYHRCYESFAKLIANEMDDETMERWGQDRTSFVIGQTKVDVDIILISAYDFRERRWKENGWAEAEERTNEVLRLLVEEGRPWDDVLDEYSDFYDPPVAQSQIGQPRPNQNNKGRFRGVARNQLLSSVDESEYWVFLNGTCITDQIFFEMEVGSVAQPMKGPWGWYIPKLRHRSAPLPRVNMDDESYRDLVEQDFLSAKLAEYVQDLIEKNEVYGL